MYYALLPIALFLPISSAVFEICASLCIAAFFIKRIILFSLQMRESGFSKWPSVFVNIFRPVSHFLTLPVIVFFYATFLSVLASQVPFLSWKGFIGKTIESLILFFCVIECVNTRRRLNVLLGIFTISAFVISIDGIWQYFFKKDFIFGNAFSLDGRVMACFGHPNDFGAYLLIFVAIFVALMPWAWSHRRESKGQPDLCVAGMPRFIMVAVAAILTAIALGWTFSRGAWIGFGVAMFLIGILNRKKWYVPLICFVIFFGVFSTQMNSHRNVSFITDDIFKDGYTRVARLKAADPQLQKTKAQLFWEDLSAILSRFNGTGRYLFWSEARNVAVAAPIFGTGLNTYSEVAPRYNSNWSGYYPHNCYLQMLAEIGVVGLGAFLWVIFILFREGLKSLNKMPKGFYLSLGTGLIAGLAGFLLHSALDTNLYSTRLVNLMWIVIGLFAAVTILATEDVNSTTSAEASRPRSQKEN